MKIVSALQLLKEGKYLALNDLIYQVYDLTDWITKDYPNHFKHYYTKYIPELFNGEREILTSYAGVKIEGLCILKKSEQKVCTLFVREEARGQHLATRLLSEAFIYLGTTKPLITIAEYKVPQFTGLIKKYGWEHTQTLDASYYGNAREFVFNGTMTP